MSPELLALLWSLCLDQANLTPPNVRTFPPNMLTWEEDVQSVRLRDVKVQKCLEIPEIKLWLGMRDE